MIFGYLQGWPVTYDGRRFRHAATLAPFVPNEHPCPSCGLEFAPCAKGCTDSVRHDPCLGHIDGANSACCGHGIGEQSIWMEG